MLLVRDRAFPRICLGSERKVRVMMTTWGVIAEAAAPTSTPRGSPEQVGWCGIDRLSDGFR